MVRSDPAAAGATLRYVAQDATTGYGEAALRLVDALRATGTGVELRGWSGTPESPRGDLIPFSRDQRPGDRGGAAVPTVAHLVPEYYPHVRRAVGEGRLIAHTVWETDRIPRHWPGLLNQVDRVVVPTAWNRDVFAAGGVTRPIDVVPHVARVPVAGDGGATLGLDDDVFVFYSIGRWDERKAMFHTVRAYLDAFDGDDRVVLVIKTGRWAEMPPVAAWGTTDPMAWTSGWQVAHVVSRYPNPAHVRVEVGDWSDAQVAGLHTRGDCYVTLSRGEGWGIGAFDAATYGNPVVATGWGGLVEYLEPETSYLVGFDLVPVEHMSPASYAPDQHWAEPHLDHAADLLRQVRSDLTTARERAAPLRRQILERYSPRAVAAAFRDVLGQR
jgi:glycosyltransferase involved in cell wall biosynthesis